MPKITAPTVAEHRVAQRRALIAAAEAIIGELGVAAVSPRSVGERAGLARSSFYEYFPSKDDLLAAVALESFEEWAKEVRAAVSAAKPGRARLHAYIEATMRMTGDGKHALATRMRRTELSPKSFEAIMAMHESLAAPLRDLLDDLRIPDAQGQAALVQGLLNAGIQLIEHGMPADAVTTRINAMLDTGIHA